MTEFPNLGLVKAQLIEDGDQSQDREVSSQGTRLSLIGLTYPDPMLRRHVKPSHLNALLLMLMY